jgi:hypothetical protein
LQSAAKVTELFRLARRASWGQGKV